VQALAPIKFSICGAATAIINRNACNGTRMKQDDADRLIENVLLGIEIYKINGIDDKYALIREKINFPEDLLKRPLLPLPW
jgi:hypothetical protein